jgi:hypothetical protein
MGFKYYHPEVGKGKFEWDKEFLKYLPQVLKAKDKNHYQQFI